MTDNTIETLIAALEDPARRETAIQKLGASQDPRAIPALQQLITHGSRGDAMAYRARRDAARALGQIGHADALRPLSIALEDEHTAVRTAAAKALARLGLPDAAPLLADALNDEAVDVRGAAATALGLLVRDHQVSARPLFPALTDSDDTVRRAAFNGIAAAEAAAFADLLDALKHPNSTIRGAAADLLGRLADERAREALRSAQYDDESRWVRSRAEAALKMLPQEEFEYPTVKRDGGEGDRGIPVPKNAVEHIRQQQADWSGLLGGQPAPPAEPAPPASPAAAPDEMSADDIRALLDQLDMRLLNGEISEMTYERLVARWEDRLDRLR